MFVFWFYSCPFLLLGPCEIWADLQAAIIFSCYSDVILITDSFLLNMPHIQGRKGDTSQACGGEAYATLPKKLYTVGQSQTCILTNDFIEKDLHIFTFSERKKNKNNNP